MSLYLALKVTHLVAASAYVGVSLANGYAKARADRSGNLARICSALELVAHQNRVFLVPASVVLLATGAGMAWISGTPLTEGWLATALLLFAFLSGLLVAAVWLEDRLSGLAERARREARPLPVDYVRLSRAWTVLGVVATGAILVVLAVMAGRLALF